MTKTELDCYSRRPCRAIAKLIVIAVVMGLVYACAAHKLNDPAINRLKFNLSLPSLIVLVVTINVISLFCIALLYAAYRWVRRDLKAPRSEDIREPKD